MRDLDTILTERVSVDTLRATLRLDADEGRLFWLPRPREKFATARAFALWHTRFKGKEALATLRTDGYLSGRLFDRKYFAHVVVFALANGRWSSGCVDHIDGIKTNNRPGNLREASHTENMWNRRPNRGGESAYKCVSWHKQGRRWQVQVIQDGKRRRLGLFKDEDDAAQAYNEWALANHGRFARLNEIAR